MGYGTTSEAVAHNKPFVYIRRDFFNEQPFLVRLLSEHGLAHELRRDEFYSGKWHAKLEQAYASAPPAAASPTPHRPFCRGGEVVAQVLEREATAARAARAAGGAVADVDDGAAPSSSTPAAQKSHVVSGYLMKRPPRVVGRRMSSAVPSWTWSDGAASPALCGVEPEAAAHEDAAGGGSVGGDVAREGREAFSGFQVVEGPTAYSAQAAAAAARAKASEQRTPEAEVEATAAEAEAAAAAVFAAAQAGGGSAAAGGGGGGEGLLPDVLSFIQMLGSLRDPAARLAAAGRAPDLVEAAHCFEWGDGAEDLFVTRAPGRLDLMGGIADYSGSLVLQMPIREACLVAMQRQPPPRVATSEALGEMVRLARSRGDKELVRRRVAAHRLAA